MMVLRLKDDAIEKPGHSFLFLKKNPQKPWPNPGWCSKGIIIRV